MLILRSLSLTFLGLLAGFAAAAQTAAPAAGPQPTTVLSWVVWWLAGVVLLMAIMTGASVTSAAQRRYEAQQADITFSTADASEAPAAPAAPRAAVAEAVPTQVATQEEVYA
ncbi:hypothetical protein JAO73_21505 [Hymenobacter sp. BT523]|uniref:hypothetical protein n=1 Tax=Hymenobacter sp. BT523 TaxID=2795725 RepID=UPI0018EB2103|nr:hypothetical protein [Hymenobacter sp. BT523]MBJ6111613.1 hypothetical protein [Hymenobacter sp. BT523]